MDDFASFSLVGVVTGSQTWIQSKTASGDTLELTFQVTRRGANGGTYADLVRVRFRRDAQRAAQMLTAGTPACVTGTIGGREYNGKIYTNLNAEAYAVLAIPAARPAPQVGPEDIPAPRPAPDYSNTPF
ncbi:MAG: hypothetical protein J5654_04940 [Victivallales bacterium]|nr:hypothetical protein [Victivallales bacterium]